MTEFEKMSSKLMTEDKAGKIKNVINSPEGKKISKLIDGQALKKAALANDKDTMSQILSQVLSTEEGKSLVKKITDNFGK